MLYLLMTINNVSQKSRSRWKSTSDYDFFCTWKHYQHSTRLEKIKSLNVNWFIIIAAHYLIMTKLTILLPTEKTTLLEHSQNIVSLRNQQCTPFSLSTSPSFKVNRIYVGMGGNSVAMFYVILVPPKGTRGCTMQLVTVKYLKCLIY